MTLRDFMHCLAGRHGAHLCSLSWWVIVFCATAGWLILGTMGVGV